MSTILVVDDMAVFREPIAASLRAEGYETICAANGREALGLVKSHSPDLILLDVAMPVMDGLEFLRAVQADSTIPRPPVILLTAVSEKDYVVEAARFGVQDYQLKSQFSLDHLYHRIERCLAEHDPQGSPGAVNAAPQSATTSITESVPSATSNPAHMPTAERPATASSPGSGTCTSTDPIAALKSLKSLMKKSEVLERIEASGELRAFSPTVLEVLRLTGREDGSIEKIARAIKQDHAIAIKILKLANSVVYTRGEPVETLDKAVVRIGLAQIRQVLLNISVIDQFSSVTIGGQVSGGEFWEHAIACGLIAAEIAHTRSAEEADSAFTMGLVHDVGRLMYAREFGDDYLTVMQVARELQLPLEQVETRLLLLNHADGMDRLLHAWKFPKDLIDPVVFHHLSVGNIRRMSPRRLPEVATLALANRLCHALALGNSGNETIYPTEEFCRTLKIDATVIQRIEEKAQEQTENLKLALLAQSNETAWTDCRERYRAAIAKPFRPLFVSEAPQFDAYRIFCDQLRERSGEPPNVGIVHLTATNECERVTQDYVSAESQAGVDRLPLIILSPKAELKLKDRVMANRQHELLPTPIVIARFIEAINCALDVAESQAAA